MVATQIIEVMERFPLWGYIAIAGIFFVILVWGLIDLLCRSKTSLKTAPREKSADTAFDYAQLLGAIDKRNGRPATILLAAASLHDLPVTIPVHTAVALAADRKCLLIDLDTRRDALAKVFDLSGETHYANLSPRATGITNLDLWPAHYFSRLRQMDLKALLAAAQKKYDVIVLNAPYLATHPDRGRIIRCVPTAAIFARNKQTTDTLKTLLEPGGCRIVKILHPGG